MWIFFFLKSFTSVSYTTSELYPEKFTLSYKRFIPYLNSISPKINNFSLLEDTLTSFKPIKLILETGEWEEIDVISNTSSDDLFKYHYNRIVVSSRDSKETSGNPYNNFKLDKNPSISRSNIMNSFADKLGINNNKKNNTN
jgi:hypothetical protein